MTVYENLIEKLRSMAVSTNDERCECCTYEEDYPPCVPCISDTLRAAALAIDVLNQKMEQIDEAFTQLKVSKRSFTDWSKDIHINSVAHGWWDEERSFGDIVALCHSELSEALEEYRDNKPMAYLKDGKPEGIAVEMVDCLIRILDWFGHEGIDVDPILEGKHEYNLFRPYRHGGKVL